MHLKGQVKEALEDLLRRDIIEPVHKVRDRIPCTHRVAIVYNPKKKKVRLAPDMRILNQFTFPYTFRSEEREGLIQGVSEARVLIQYDLTHAYYSVEVDKEDQNYQCISIDGAAYRIKRLVQGSNMGRRQVLHSVYYIVWCLHRLVICIVSQVEHAVCRKTAALTTAGRNGA